MYVVPFKENVIPAYTCPSLVPTKFVEPAPAENCRLLTVLGAIWVMFVFVIV